MKPNTRFVVLEQIYKVSRSAAELRRGWIWILSEKKELRQTYIPHDLVYEFQRTLSRGNLLILCMYLYKFRVN